MTLVPHPTPPHPISSRSAAQGWAGIESLLQQLPGQQLEVVQGSDEQGRPTERRQGSGRAAAEAAEAAASGRRRKVMVVFIGGATYAEVGVASGWRGKGTVPC